MAQLLIAGGLPCDSEILQGCSAGAGCPVHALPCLRAAAGQLPGADSWPQDAHRKAADEAVGELGAGTAAAVLDCKPSPDYPTADLDAVALGADGEQTPSANLQNSARHHCASCLA